MKYGSIIFDMDGTLLDSMGFWSKIDTLLLERENITVPDDLDDILAPLSYQESAQYLADTFPLSLSPEQVLEDLLGFAQESYRNSLLLKPGAEEFVKWLHKKGYRMGICSATDQRFIEVALERLGLLDYFTFILSCDEFEGGKSRPDIYLAAAKRLGGSAERTIVFEDALHCVKTAKAAGFCVVGVADEASARHEREIESICDGFLRSFGDGPDLIKSLEEER